MADPVKTAISELEIFWWQTQQLQLQSGSRSVFCAAAELARAIVLTVILLRGAFGVLHRTSYGGYVSQLHP